MEKLAVINGVDVELEVVDNAVYTTSLEVKSLYTSFAIIKGEILPLSS
ncbi:hypothetical protein J5B53_000161 [Campylobacter coli]|nr:hypothetical protein [Campylobacter coli]